MVDYFLLLRLVLYIFSILIVRCNVDFCLITAVDSGIPSMGSLKNIHMYKI